MKNYIKIESTEGYVISYQQGESLISFTEAPDNSDYQEYLRYTEWVEAGNNPEDFWSQSEDFLTLSEGSQPNGEEI